MDGQRQNLPVTKPCTHFTGGRVGYWCGIVDIYT